MTNSRSIMVLNGANLNMLGVREPDVYGTASLADIEKLCTQTAQRLGCNVICHQTNDEGEMLRLIHGARAGGIQGIVINAGAWTHTSVAIHDALRIAEVPVVEVHISNIYARESFRHHSFIAPLAIGIISGLGIQGYAWAIEALASRN